MSKRKRESKKSQKKTPQIKKEYPESQEEAIEEHGFHEESSSSSEEEPSGEDLNQNISEDYEEIPQLDVYEQEGIDDATYAKMSIEERKKVEKILNQRKKKVKSKIPIALLEEMEGSDEEEALRLKRRKMMAFGEKIKDDEFLNINENIINNEKVKGGELNWIMQPQGARYIRSSFTKFLKTYKEEDKDKENVIYEKRIIEMSTENKQSLEINFSHIQKNNNLLAKWIMIYPDTVIPYLNDVAFELTCEIFPRYSDIYKEIYVRIKDFSITMNLRNLRCEDIGHLIKIKGVITKRTNVIPKMKTAYFTCIKCGEENGPFNYSTDYINNNNDILNIGSCPVCQSKGPYKLVSEKCLYRNYQRITIQESPGTVPAGRVPRQKEIILTNDLVDIARPGDEVEITGIYTSIFDTNTNIKTNFPVFNTFIEANNIKRLNDIDIQELTDDDKAEMIKISKNKNITYKIFNSIAPSIYGNEFIKKSLALALFGGVSKDPSGKHRIRGDINILLLGDPGTAKSQFLKYLQNVFSRSVYTTGKGASAVGLTASVQKDPVTKEWTLEGGALVLADKGICLIDEFDKMNDQDRTSIHEAMEQQSISISKAGIVTSLQARCSVIAAANPIKGRYDNALNFNDNVELTEPILSRFDILAVVKDNIDSLLDDKMARFVINSHILSHPNGYEEKNLIPSLDDDNDNDNNNNDIISKTKESLSQETLKKYIIYARKHIHPKLNDINKNKVSKFYSELRKVSEETGGIQIAVRHLESMLRMAEAHAKMELRENVKSEDIDFAIQMLLESFLQSQKYSIAKSLRKKFMYYLHDKSDNNNLLVNLISKKIKEQINYLRYFNKINENVNEVKINKEQFEKDAQDLGIKDFDDFYKSNWFKRIFNIDENDIICMDTNKLINY